MPTYLATLIAAEQFHESFYATAAQVIPVLMLTLVFQLGLGKRSDDEDIGLSLWMMATFLAMALGELVAFIALVEQENLPLLSDFLIWGALVWGVMMIAARPILRRWEAVHEAIPLWVSLAFRYGLLLTIAGVVLLGMFDVVDASVLPVVGTVVVFLFLVAGMVVEDGRRIKTKKDED